MSIIASNCNEICHSPTNTSKSKMLYTFPKGPRFNFHSRTMYKISNKLGARHFMKLIRNGLKELPILDMEKSTISLNSISFFI